tara:strand:+ start:438 stop:548 length:111 start_codon:yes stop_codon:yes gene_type:complete
MSDDHSHEAVDWDGKAFIWMLSSMILGCTIIMVALY